MEKSKNLIVLSGTILSIRENKKNTVLIVKSKGESKEANVEFVFYDTSVLKGITPKMKVKIRAHGENRKSEDGFGNAYFNNQNTKSGQIKSGRDLLLCESGRGST